MYCTNCGAKIADGSRFCTECGAKIEEMDNAPSANNTAVGGQNEVKKTKPGIKVNGINAVVRKIKDFGSLLGKPGGLKKMVPTVLIAVVALVAVIGIFTFIFGSGSSGDNAYVYLSGGRYELIKNLNGSNTDSIEMATAKSDSIFGYSPLVVFSPDGKYVYYYTKMNSDSYTGTLNRAEYSKLKKDSSKNDKYIETIDSNVSIGITLINDEEILYKSGESGLYYYDGKETELVHKNVTWYNFNDKGKVVYQVDNSDGSSSLYSNTLSDLSKEEKIASNISYVLNGSDLDHILYVKYNEDSESDLYSVGTSTDSAKIADNIEVVKSDGEELYFTADSGEKISLYDYVEDDYAEDDTGISEPDLSSYEIPTYSYSTIDSSSAKESDYFELYTSTSRSLYWYGESYWYSYSMEDAVDYYWGDDTDAIVAATQSFIDKYSGSADEDGYILVTDDVKADLKKINAAADDTEENEWLWLCFSKTQTGTDYDYDAYYADYDKYEAVASRIELREALQSGDNDYPIKTLYRFVDGELTVVSESVLNTLYEGDLVAYNTLDMITEKVDITEISGIYGVESLFSIRISDGQLPYFIASGSDKPVQWTEATTKSTDKIADEYESDSGSYSYDSAACATEDCIFIDEGNGYIYVAPIKSGKIGEFSLLSDDAHILRVDDSTMYYMENAYSTDSGTYCDLYAYTDGKSTRIAQDVLSWSGYKFSDDDMVFGYTGSSSGGYELTMFDKKGNKTVIGDEISQYYRIDKSKTLYVSDGDLYLTDGKNKNRIASDVDFLWIKDKMNAVSLSGY